MNREKQPRAAAVIDIGSGSVKMRVSCVQKGSLRDLERLEYPVALGHEVFLNGKISFESQRLLTTIIDGYQQVLREYGITQCSVVATTAFREAKNRAYVADMLKVQNGLNIHVLENVQEKTLIYSEIIRRLTEEAGKAPDGTLLSYIGTGSIGTALYDGDGMVFSQNISMGSLKLHDVFHTLEGESVQYADLLDEYLLSTLGRVRLPELKRPIENLVLTGNELELIARLCGMPLNGEVSKIPASAFLNLYQEVRGHSARQISERLEIPEAEAEPLYTALALYCHFCALVNITEVVCLKVEPWDALIRQALLQGGSEAYEEHVRENALSCAMGMARHYGCNLSHARLVQGYANLFFDRMQKQHGLSRKKRLILELACLLHESGYYVNAKHHLRSTFDLIKDTDIYGLTDEEVLLVAYVARFTDFLAQPAVEPQLSEKNKVTVAKLVAIFRLANALDKSGGHKLHSVSVRFSKGTLRVTALSEKNTVLEKWAFETAADFYEEVFGVRPLLTVKSGLLSKGGSQG